MTEQEFLQLYGGVDPVYLESNANPLSTFGPSYVEPNRAGIMPLQDLGFKSPPKKIPFGGMNPWEMKHYAGRAPYASPGDVNPFYSSSDPIATGGYVPHVTEHSTVAPPIRPDNTWDFGAETPFSLGRTAPPGPQDPTVLSAPRGILNANAVYETRPENSLLAPSTGNPTSTFGPAYSTADPSLYGGSEQALTSATAEAGLEAGADSATGGFGGPEAFAANMALNMIPTRDRKKQSTAFGDEGSASGILKGAGKGALTGFTLSGGNPYGALAGGVVGAIGGTQGYFDSTSAPVINMSRIKRGGGGMRGGLLGGGMYG